MAVFCQYFFSGSGRDSFPDQVLASVSGSIGSLILANNVRPGPILRKELLRDLQRQGWTSQALISPSSRLTISGISHATGLCVQFGNAARLYADILKLQAAFNDKSIQRAIYVVPSRSLAKRIGSNIATSDRLISELKLFKKIITLPLAIASVQEGYVE